jgi:hypothetical protein
MLLRGKANFRNVSGYGRYEEKTYSRGFRRAFEFVEFNRLSLKPVTHSGNTLIAALDCSFIPKSGTHLRFRQILPQYPPEGRDRSGNLDPGTG